MKRVSVTVSVLLLVCLVAGDSKTDSRKRKDSSNLDLQLHEVRKRWTELGLTAQCGVCVVKCFPKIQNVKSRAKSCFDHLRDGKTQSGYYTIFDSKNHSFPVYCDMTSEPRSAWTLVMSWSMTNKNAPQIKRNTFSANAPLNEGSPNWLLYRLSHSRMQSIQSQSTHWRSTCSFPSHGVDYIDYVRGKFHDLNIMTFHGYKQCKKVEYINIRGHVGSYQTVRFWQLKNSYLLHTDSSSKYPGCQFDPSSGSVNEEDNFGFYEHTNPNFRCTAGPQATTQWWFGKYMT